MAARLSVMSDSSFIGSGGYHWLSYRIFIQRMWATCRLAPARLGLAPDQAVHVVRVTLDHAHDLLRDVRDCVVRHKSQCPLFVAALPLQNPQSLGHALPLEADHHDRRLLHTLRPLMGLANVERREIQDRGLLSDGPAVGQRRLR